MAKKRRSHSAEFKFKIVLEALKGDKTINQIATDYSINPIMIRQWKKAFIDNGKSVFDKKGDSSEIESLTRQKTSLERKVGELTMSVDFLKKKVDPLLPGSSIHD